MTTKAPAVKKALKALLEAMPLTAADKLQVSFNVPVRNIQKKWTFVGETTWATTEWVTNRSRQEVFSVTVGFSAQISGGTAEDAEDYVSAMAQDFEAALQADPGLSGLCISTSFTPKRMNAWPIDQAFEAQFETEVTAKCRP